MPKFQEEFEAFIDVNGDTIRQGYYRKISGRGNNENQVLISGFYKDNLPHGAWQIYGALGNYADGNKVGVWQYANFEFGKPNVTFRQYANGEKIISPSSLLQKYDYTNKKLLLNRDDTLMYQTCLDFTTLNPIKVDKLPVCIGTYANIGWVVADDITYPRQAAFNKIQGKVQYGLKIDEQGNIIDVVLIKGLGYGCDEVVIDALKKHKDKIKFVPAQKAGKNVPICLVLPFSFKLV